MIIDSIINYFENTGLKEIQVNNPEQEKYIPTKDKEIAKGYLKYLEDLFNYQKSRQETIENKNSQLLGQASIVISIVAFFIPLFYEKFGDISPLFKWTVVISFVSAVFHYSMTIYNAGLILQINKYPYSNGRTRTITKESRATNEIDFLNEQIGDLVYAINNNIIQNNKKGNSLINAGYCFKIGNFIFLVFTLILLFGSINKIEKTPEVKITNFKDIPCCDKKDSSKSGSILIDQTQNLIINNKIEIIENKIDSLVIKLNILISQRKGGKRKKHECPPCP